MTVETTFENAKVKFKYGAGYINSQGYRMFYRPNNYDCDCCGFVRFHRYKYSLCNKVVLIKSDVIHHEDGNKLNNMKSNLIKTTKEEHDRKADNQEYKKLKRLSRQLYMNGLQIQNICHIVNRNRNSVSGYIEDLKEIRKNLFKNKVLKLRNNGLSYKEIASEVNSSVATVYCIANGRKYE